MISAEEFLKKFKDAQVSSLAQQELSLTNSSGIELDSTLTSAIQRGWYIAPVLTRSKHFLRGALAGYPTLDLDQVRHWAWEYAECGCNWAVETGERSSLLILEFTYDIGREMIHYLCEGDWSWRTTVQFTDSKARFVCFRYSGQQIRKLGTKLQGIRIHLGSCLLIPPSVMTKRSPISYLDPCARVLDLPDWLLDVQRTTTETLNASDKCDRGYIVA